MPLDRLERRDFASGGLISYGPDPRDQYPLAAGYVDRIVEETEKWGKVVKLSGAKLD